MSRNFLFVLLSLTIAGLLWGAQGDSPDGTKVDNNESSRKMAVAEGGGPRSSAVSGLSRMSYLALRMASRMPMSLLRTLARLPRQVARNVTKSLSRLTVAFKDYATDMLGYLASSERTELVRVRRGVPAPATASGPKSTRRGGMNMNFLLFSLFAYPMKVAFKTALTLLRFSPLGVPINLFSSLVSGSGVLLRNPLARKIGNATVEMADYAIARAWNVTKRSILPRLDSLVNNLKDSGTMPESLVAVLVELQTLYHIFKFLGMA